MQPPAAAWLAAAAVAWLAKAAPLPRLQDVTRYEGYNCYEGHGGRRVDLDNAFADPFPDIMPAEECLQRCLMHDRCEAFLIVGRHVENGHPADGPCWLRSEVRLDECDKGAAEGAEPYDLFVLAGHGAQQALGGDEEYDGPLGESIHTRVSRVSEEDNEAEEQDEDSSSGHLVVGFLLSIILLALCLFLLWAVWYITGENGWSRRGGAKLLVEPKLETRPAIVEEHTQVGVEVEPPLPPPDVVTVVRPPRPPPYIPPPEPAPLFATYQTGLTRDSYVPGKGPLVFRRDLEYSPRPDYGPEVSYWSAGPRRSPYDT